MIAMDNARIWLGVFYVLTLGLPKFIHSVRMLEICVPKFALKNTTAQLKCLYDLDDELLYSVKWYKDGNEFYRYMPMGSPKVETFPLPGIDVDLNTSHEANVTLNDLGFESSGRYRCEISAEAPSFQTVTETASMLVVVIPKHGNPQIYGARPRYQIGDWVQVNCTAGPSKPAVKLAWSINDEPAEKHNLRTYPTITMNRDGFETIILGLQFRVEAHLFRYGDLRLKCVASLPNIYWRSSEEVIEVDRPQKAHVLDASIYNIHSGADPVMSTSTRESFATKFLSMITQTNAANGTVTNVLPYLAHLCLAVLVAGGSITELLSKSVRKLISIKETELPCMVCQRCSRQYRHRQSIDDKKRLCCCSHLQAKTSLPNQSVKQSRNEINTTRICISQKNVKANQIT